MLWINGIPKSTNYGVIRFFLHYTNKIWSKHKFDLLKNKLIAVINQQIN